MNPLPSVGQAFALISQEESHRYLISDSFAPPENMASAFFSRQDKSRDRNKEILTCDYCHWTGQTKATCYNLVGYPPGHKYYKSKPQGQYHRQSKNFFTEQSKCGYANMTVTKMQVLIMLIRRFLVEQYLHQHNMQKF